MNRLFIILYRASTKLADLKLAYEVNETIKHKHKMYKAKKKALLREKKSLERAHMKMVSLHEDAMRMYNKKDTNVKLIFETENDLSKEDDEDKSEEEGSKRQETNAFLATLLSGFFEATSQPLPSMDLRPPSPKYETLLKYTFYFYFFIIVCHNPNINFLL